MTTAALPLPFQAEGQGTDTGGLSFLNWRKGASLAWAASSPATCALCS